MVIPYPACASSVYGIYLGTSHEAKTPSWGQKMGGGLFGQNLCVLEGMRGDKAAWSLGTVSPAHLLVHLLPGAEAQGFRVMFRERSVR